MVANVYWKNPALGKAEKRYKRESAAKWKLIKLLAQLVNVTHCSVFGSHKKPTITCNEIPRII